MSESCLDYIQSALELADEMLDRVREAEAECEDDACLVLFSVIRDSAYRIRQTAQRESRLLAKSQSGRVLQPVD
jgi:hypothetical protein